VAAVVLARLLVHRLREDGVPFAVTVEELGRDAALFTSVGDAFESGGAKPDADSAENELTARSVRRPS
jgi:hypothetical protein